MHEFFQLNPERLIKDFENVAKEKGVEEEPKDVFLPLIQDPEFKRFGGRVDLELASKIFNRERYSFCKSINLLRAGTTSEDERIQQCVQAFANHLNALNKEAASRADEIVNCGIDAILGHVHYERVADHGPKRGAITLSHPLVTK